MKLLPRKATHIGVRNHSRFSILINYGWDNIYNPLFSIKYSLPIARRQSTDAIRSCRVIKRRVGTRLSRTLNLQVNWQKGREKINSSAGRLSATTLLKSLLNYVGTPVILPDGSFMPSHVPRTSIQFIAKRFSPFIFIPLIKSHQSRFLSTSAFSRLPPRRRLHKHRYWFTNWFVVVIYDGLEIRCSQTRTRQWVSRKLLNFYFVVSSFIGLIGVAGVPAHDARELKMALGFFGKYARLH